MDVPNAECMRDPELWEHLVQLTKIVNKSISQETRNCEPNEIDQLRHENEVLRNENELLHKRIQELESCVNDRDVVANYKRERLNGSERLLLTQETVLSENHEDDPDLTDSSPVKSQNSATFRYLNSSQNLQPRCSKRLFEENTDANMCKKIKSESQSDEDLLGISQIDDSQEGSVNNNTSILHTILASNTNISEIQKVDLTQNPTLKRPWFPEDFIKNPEYEKHVNDRSKNRKSVPSHISAHFQRQQKYIQSIALNDFNKVAMGEQDELEDSNKENDIREYSPGLITPPQNCKTNFKNPFISPMYKFEINKQNLDRYLKYFPNLLRTNKVRNWEVEDSAENDVCADFLLTQDVEEKNSRAKERAQLKGLRMLFQSCFVVENGVQLGTYIFRNKEFNQKVCRSEFVLNLSVFQ